MTLNKLERKERMYAAPSAYHLNTGTVPCNSCICQDECPHFKKNSQCQLIIDYRDQLRGIISSEPHITESDSIMVSLLINELCFQAIAHRWFAKVGFFIYDKETKIIDTQPLLKMLYNSINITMRICEKLGLTPEARAKLGLSQEEDMGSIVRRLALPQEEEDNP